MIILCLLKLYRQSHAMRFFVQALLAARYHLSGMLLLVYIFVLFSAVGIREIQRDVQPEKFGTLFVSISSTLVTLRSVGYDDAVPISKVGKVFCSICNGCRGRTYCCIYRNCGGAMYMLNVQKPRSRG